MALLDAPPQLSNWSYNGEKHSIPKGEKYPSPERLVALEEGSSTPKVPKYPYSKQEKAGIPQWNMSHVNVSEPAPPPNYTAQALSRIQKASSEDEAEAEPSKIEVGRLGHHRERDVEPPLDENGCLPDWYKGPAVHPEVRSEYGETQLSMPARVEMMPGDGREMRSHPNYDARERARHDSVGGGLDAWDGEVGSYNTWGDRGHPRRDEVVNTYVGGEPPVLAPTGPMLPRMALNPEIGSSPTLDPIMASYDAFMGGLSRVSSEVLLNEKDQGREWIGRQGADRAMVRNLHGPPRNLVPQGQPPRASNLIGGKNRT